MTTIPFPLTPYEAEAAARGELGVIIRPCGVQAKFMQQLRNGSFEMSQDGGFDCDVSVVVPPAQPGDVIVGLESWHKEKGLGLLYEAEHLEATGICWQPAATMPPEFARHRWPVESVECKRLHPMPAEHAAAAGFDWPESEPGALVMGQHEFVYAWDVQFPAYPWDSNLFVWLHWLGGAE